MKVYVKKGEYQTPTMGLIITIVFLTFSIGIFGYMFTFDSFIEALAEVGIGFVFSLLFFSFGVLFIYFLLKKPKKYIAKLISKEETTYNGKKITYMCFELLDKEEPEEDDEEPYEDEEYLLKGDYQCYTYESNPLTVNNTYNIYVKEFNWQITKVDTDISLDNIEQKKSTKRKISPFYLVMGLFALMNISLGVLGLICYSEYAFYYILWIGIFLLPLIFSIKGIISDINDQIESDENLWVNYPSRKNINYLLLFLSL